MTSKTTAVVLLNVGGPSSLKDVYPFLVSFFSDPAILTFPLPFRYVLSRILASVRLKKSKHIYEQLGGGSPLLPQTLSQANSLEKELGDGYKVFVAMRHAAPFIKDVSHDVSANSFEKTILLPLCPHYSSTTNGSFFQAWEAAHGPCAIRIPSYPTLDGFLEAIVELTTPCYTRAKKEGVPRVLFTAHGLPEKIIQQGDPYQRQIEETAAALKKKMGFPDINVCYQSRVGFLPWIGPSLEEEIRKAGKEKRPLVVVPISFVSEHSETLIELDVDMKILALKAGCPHYERVQTVQTHPSFIKGLASLVRNS
jgi:ferrochelatase